MVKKANLGCGFQKFVSDENTEWVNIDIREEVKPDIVADLTKGIPLIEDNTFDEIFSICMLEQIDRNEDFRFVMNEIWRILKPGGKFLLKVPNALYDCAYQDPFDVRFFNEASWNYFDVDKPEYRDYSYGLKPWTNISCSTAESGIMTVIMHKPVSILKYNYSQQKHSNMKRVEDFNKKTMKNNSKKADEIQERPKFAMLFRLFRAVINVVGSIWKKDLF